MVCLYLALTFELTHNLRSDWSSLRRVLHIYLKWTHQTLLVVEGCNERSHTINQKSSRKGCANHSSALKKFSHEPDARDKTISRNADLGLVLKLSSTEGIIVGT